MFAFSNIFALNFPMIDPVLVHVGPFAIHWYALGYIVGIFFAFFYGCFLLKKPHLWPNNQSPFRTADLENFIILAFIGILFGGRLGAVLLWDPSFYFQHPLEIFLLWHGGMAFHGGLIGLSLAAIFFAYKHKISLLNLFDILAAGAPLGIGLVRLCNFINNELWGRVTDVAWGVYFPNAGPLPRHPSQIYEAFLEGFLLLIVLALLIFCFSALKRPGLITGYFLIFYSFARIFSEFFRDPDVPPHWFANFETPYFTYGMFLSLPMLVLGVGFIMYAYFYARTKQKV